MFGSGKHIVGESDVGTNHHIVFQLNAIPHLYAAFDSDIVAYLHIVLNEAVGTDIHVLPYLRTWQHHAILPNIGAFRYILVLTVREWMYHAALLSPTDN